MRVLLVNKYYHLRSGTERCFLDLQRLLEHHGHTVAVFSMAHPQNLPSPYSHLFVPHLDFRRLRAHQVLHAATRVVWYRAAAVRIARLVDDFRPDLVHLFNTYHHLSPSILPPLAQRGIPVVQTVNDYKLVCPNYLLFTGGKPCLRCTRGHFVHAVLHRCLGSVPFSLLAAVEMHLHRALRALRHIQHFVAPSAFVRQILVDCGFAAHRVTVVPHFVHPGEAMPGPGEYIIYAGRLSREKGLSVLLEAMCELRDIPLVVAGDGPLREALLTQASRLGLRRVTFAGHLSPSALREALARSRFSVIPSTWYEVFGMGTLEAWAVGRPVVASRIGALPEVIRDHQDGVLVEPADSRALAEALHWLWNHPAEAAAMGQSGHWRALEEFGPDVFWERLSAVYRRLLA